MRLTKANIASLTLPEGKSEVLIFDTTLPGFGIRLRAGGKKTWIAQYRTGTKQRRMTLGTIEAVDPDEARKRAKNILSKVQLGADPQIEKVEAREQAAITLKSVSEKYLVRAKKRLAPRTFEETERHLTKHWLPILEMPIQRIQRADISRRLAEIANASGPFASNRARASLSALFSWAIGEGLLEANPVVGTNKAVDETPRDRILTDLELALIWQFAGTGEYGAIIRLLILTGQRREEVGGLLWSEVDVSSALWTIGSERTKNGKSHEIPLSKLTLDVISSQSKREDRDLVFGAGNGAFQGWSNAKEALDRRILIALKTAHGEKAKLKPWRLHDIRRTVATRLSDLGVFPHVVEAILNHISGHKAGVAGIYNRATYTSEKCTALQMWANHINNLNCLS